MTDFFTSFFLNPNVQIVLLGTFLIGASAGLIGTFTFLNKRSLLGDAISHATLPGVCLSFMIVGEKNILYLLLGAFASGALATYAVQWIVAVTKIKNDTAIAVVLSGFFGLGIMLLTFIQQSGNAAQSGLNSFLIGNSAAMNQYDVFLFSLLAICIALTVIILYKPLEIVIFNKDYARSIGLPVRFYSFLISSLVVLTISIGIQAVGVIMMAALLITPPAVAGFWTHKLTVMLLIASLVGGCSGVVGSIISFQAENMPTGPWIVSFLSVLAILSALFAPGKGVWARIQLQLQNRKKIQLENVMKTIYQWHEQNEYQEPNSFTIQVVVGLKNYEPGLVEKHLMRAKKFGWIVQPDSGYYQLTNLGWDKSKRIVRLHRLWELYLNKKMNLKEDHIHANAETMEHILTPKMEKMLLQELDYPDRDPHDSHIPK